MTGPRDIEGDGSCWRGSSSSIRSTMRGARGYEIRGTAAYRRLLAGILPGRSRSVVVGEGLAHAMGELTVPLDIVGEHGRRRQQVADEDLPARHLVEHPLGQDEHRA